MSANEYRVEITGWAATTDGPEETFEDDIVVGAPSEDAAVDAAVVALKLRWGYDYVEIGDCRVSHAREVFGTDWNF